MVSWGIYFARPASFWTYAMLLFNVSRLRRSECNDTSFAGKTIRRYALGVCILSVKLYSVTELSFIVKIWCDDWPVKSHKWWLVFTSRKSTRENGHNVQPLSRKPRVPETFRFHLAIHLAWCRWLANKTTLFWTNTRFTCFGLTYFVPICHEGLGDINFRYLL